MSIFQLLHFIATLSNYQLPSEVAIGAAVDIRDVALEEKPILHVACESCKTEESHEAFDRAASACLASVWFYRESAFDPTVGGDGGTSFGLPQMKAQYVPIVEISLDAIRTDRKESARAGFRLLRHEIKRCGGVVSGLGAYATGKCGGAKEKVEHRLKLAEACWSKM